jgi:hypothetical protein
MRILLLSLILLAGCTNTIIPPSAPAEPVTITLLDHGRHPSLIIPRGDGSNVRFVYGDWSWYAMGRTGFFQLFDAMLFPSKGALGRKVLSTKGDFEDMRRRDPVRDTYTITVERSRADALRETLESAFQSRLSTAHYNGEYDLHFVHSPGRYWALRNCNHVMANWLRAAGCRVRGTNAFSSWRVRQDSVRRASSR